MRYFADIAFRGAPYHGWQIQPGDVSVQQALEDALGKVLRTPTPVTGAGRTDAGVNARRMIAHFDAEAKLSTDECTNLCRALCAICRPDIVVRSITPVADDAHARFDAMSRTYRYFVNTKPDPFAYPLSWFVNGALDFDAMNVAAKDLIGRQDFTSFSKLHTDVKTNICTVMHARWYTMDEPGRYYFEITADRFLRNMVRAVVGTLVDIGRHKAPANHIASTLAAMNRCAAGTSMPAHALFLWDVTYPQTLYTPPEL